MEARLLKSLAIAVAILFAIPAADALNLGTLQKQTSASINSGETAVFRALFWNSGEEAYTVNINEAQAPEGWLVIVLPRQFRLGGAPLEKTERIYLPGNKKTIGAQAVDVYLTAPERTVSGEYEIILNAAAGESKDAGFSLIQERKLIFKVNVSGNSEKTSDGANNNYGNGSRSTIINILPPISETGSGGIEMQPEGAQYATPPDTDSGNKKIVSIILIFGILILARRLYKYG